MMKIKKLLAIFMSVCVIATFTVPAFAADTLVYKSEAQVLHNLGIYNGISTTIFNPDLSTILDRQTGVVLLLRLFGLEEKALSMTNSEVTLALQGYTDVSKIGIWAIKQMAYAVKNGLVQGITTTTVGPKNYLTGKMYCTLILRQLGYTPNYNEAPAQLSDAGGLTVLQAIKFMDKILIKDDFVGISYGTLNAFYSNGTKVIQRLVDLGFVSEAKAIEAGLIVGLKIVSIANPSDLSLKVGSEVFIPKVASATYSNGSVSNVFVTWDSKAVVTNTVTTTPFIVEGTVFGTTLKVYIKINVVVAPIAISAVSRDQQSVIVTFNKAITSTNITSTTNFIVDANTNQVDKVVASGSNAVIVTFKSNLTSGTHAITVNNSGTNADPSIKDYSGFFVAKTVLNFINTIDTSAPTVPSNITALSISANQINLNWAASTDDNGVVGYKIFRNGVQVANIANIITYSDLGLVPGTLYSYNIYAYDLAGNNSSKSNTAVAATYSSIGIDSGLKAEYFDNTDFTNLKLSRVDPNINFSWGTVAPNTSMNVDTYSVRWTGQLIPMYTEEYTFSTLSDDGVALWVNGTRIINNWNAHSVTENTGKIKLTAGQKVDIKLEYYQYNGDSTIKLSWTSINQIKQIIPQNQLLRYLKDNTAPTVPTNISVLSASDNQLNISWTASTDANGVAGYKVFRDGTQITSVTNATSFSDVGLAAGTVSSYSVSAYDSAGNNSSQSHAIVAATFSSININSGLTGEYYDNIDFTNLKLTRVDPNINFSWGAVAPSTSMSADTYSVRWTGQLIPLYTGECTFSTLSDDGVAVWVNGSRVINNWNAHSVVENTGEINLTAGRKVDIKIEYFQSTADSTIKLYWSSAIQVKQIIPQNQLLDK